MSSPFVDVSPFYVYLEIFFFKCYLTSIIFIIKIIFLLGMATMKENKGKEVMDEVVR